MASVREVRPPPLASLPRWRREAVALGRALLRHLGPVPPPRTELLGPRWEALLGGALLAWPLAPSVLGARDLGALSRGATLAAVGAHATLGVAVALVDRPFALTLARLALGSGEGSEGALSEGLSPSHEGALMVLASRALTLAFAPSPPPVLRAVTDRVDDALGALESPSGEVLVWPWRLSLGDEAGGVTLVVSEGARTRLAALDARSVEASGELLVGVSVVAARGALTAEGVSALAPGDVLTLRSVRWEGEGLSGGVGLALGEAMIPGTLSGEGVRLTGDATVTRSEATMHGDEGPKAVKTEVLAGVPVEVSVELAQGRVSVAEVSAWRVGEVVTLGARWGEPVVLRAGGRVIARGELVDVEGEVGVRLTERW